MAQLLPYLNADLIEVGCDEAGRGCLAGPVTAAAVIIPKGIVIKGLNDSKQLTEANRLALKDEIENKCYWSVQFVAPKIIDEINILNASILAMHLALKDLKHAFEHILVDGNRFKAYQQIPHTTVVKGDGKFQSIAAASILAKTHRDAHMSQLHESYPMYAWSQNKGYPTQAHRSAIAAHGPCIEHRKSFTLLPSQMQLF